MIQNSACSRYEQIYGAVECGDKDMNEWCGRFTDPNNIVEGLSGTTLFKEVCPATCEPFEPEGSHNIFCIVPLVFKMIDSVDHQNKFLNVSFWNFRCELVYSKLDTPPTDRRLTGRFSDPTVRP